MVSPLCHGSYLLEVKVTDDDVPDAMSDSAQVGLSIGNCDFEICIDYPTTANFLYLQAGDSSDATIFFHLNSVLYANPAYAWGVRLELALFHESDIGLTHPVYTGQFDYDVLSASLTGLGVARWHGYTNDGRRAPPGKYTVRIRAVNPLLPSPFTEAIQPQAIWLDVLDVTVASTSDSLLSLNRASTGADALRINYAVSSTFTTAPPFDEARLHVRSKATPNAVLASIPIPAPTSGTFSWNGETSSGILLPPGTYTVEVEIRKAGRSLGTSPPHLFTAYHIAVQVGGTPAASKQIPGAVLEVSGAAKNVTVKLEPGMLAGLVSLRTTGNPGSTEVKDGTTVLATDAAGGAVQPAGGYGVPRIFVVKMLKGTADPTRLELSYSPAVSQPGKDAVDFINLQGLDVGVRPFCSDDGVNASRGAFVQRNSRTIDAMNFKQLTFVMHPISVTSQPMLGRVTEVTMDYESGGSNIVELYETSGAARPLPKTWDASDFDFTTKKLDVHLLANGKNYGEVVFVLRYKADGNTIAEKRLKLRVGDMPGIAGTSVSAYPHFLYQRVVSEVGAGSVMNGKAALDPFRYADRVGRAAKVYVVSHKTPEEWATNQTIIPAFSADIVISGSGIQSNVTPIPDAAIPANNLKGYDVVYDFGTCPSDPANFHTDNVLNPGDIVDSIALNQPSLVTIPNTLAPGTLGVLSFEYGMPSTPPSAPVITADPVSQTVAVGGTATFSVTATGSGLSYQWLKNGVVISGATLPSYTTGPVAPADSGDRYRCVVSNLVNGVAGSVRSAEVVLSTSAPSPALPVITADPVRQTVTEGRTVATFIVAATGPGIKYQWQKNGVDILGAMSSTYTTGLLPMAEDGARYRCVVSNGAGTVTSAEVVLSIVPAKTSVPAAYDGLSKAFDFRLRGRVAYPNPMPPGKLPLIAFAHGRHVPQWIFQGGGWIQVPASFTSDENYRGHTYLQEFLASRGYITVSVDLDETFGYIQPGPAGDVGYPEISTGGIRLRANILLRNIEEVIDNVTLGGGVVSGKVDSSQVYVMGHSRGAEAVIVANSLQIGAIPSPAPQSAKTIRGVISLAPVSFDTGAIPAGLPFLLMYGSADGDVNGCCSGGLVNPGIWPFQHFDRAGGPAYSIYIRGANHNFWNDSWPADDAKPMPPAPNVGASLITKAQQQAVVKAYTLAFLKVHQEKLGPYERYLLQPPAALRPAGLPGNTTVPLLGSVRLQPGASREVIDDHTANFGNKLLSSSGATIAPTSITLDEVVLADPNVGNETDIQNRFFQDTNGAIVGWSAAGRYTVTLLASQRDLRNASVALRVAIQPKDGPTVLPDIDFNMTLVDGLGNISSVPASAWRLVRGTYRSTVDGDFTTKAAFETFVFPWWSFVANGRSLNLEDVREIRLESLVPAGPVGIDDLEIWR